MGEKEKGDCKQCGDPKVREEEESAMSNGGIFGVRTYDNDVPLIIKVYDVSSIGIQHRRQKSCVQKSRGQSKW